MAYQPAEGGERVHIPVETVKCWWLLKINLHMLSVRGIRLKLKHNHQHFAVSTSILHALQWVDKLLPGPIYALQYNRIPKINQFHLCNEDTILILILLYTLSLGSSVEVQGLR